MEWLGVFMLKISNISYRYTSSQWLFQRLSLCVQKGEVVGVSGESGCGKTTMAKIIAGYLIPTEGEISVDGKKLPYSGMSPVQLIWQHPEKAINPKWRMHKVLAESGSISPDLLRTLGIHYEWLDRFPGQLSGGELQRFCIARALGSNPGYLLVDEMTAMHDSVTQAQIWHAVLQIVKQRNIGILVISHDNYLLQRICNRIIDFKSLIKK
ncbi:ABC transporter ATP-binding protein [Virgibacillus sp. W0430]|uniref:ABC transporter ATP-binding protein n=1 Tax=Virgibacillus sp. W0430 TaxID=3391580 RepID=UPI003F6DF7C3